MSIDPTINFMLTGSGDFAEYPFWYVSNVINTINIKLSLNMIFLRLHAVMITHIIMFFKIESVVLFIDKVLT
ncbi:MlrC domain protein [Ehrlichia ruminantium]|uniref:MlrC domain protein n=1 Tax=Ehrlichia ruminantium TaxID=779 RepID=A0A161LYB5_EHRRU|nr:MlrC domain protein [Ehrlichia ruminantium]